MNQDQDNPLLDASLEELLGGKRPPDLSARILQAWAAQQADLTWHATAANIASQSPQAVIASSGPQEVFVSLHPSSAFPSRRRKSAFGASLGIGAGVALVAAGLIAAVMVVSQQDREHRVAVAPTLHSEPPRVVQSPKSTTPPAVVSSDTSPSAPSDSPRIAMNDVPPPVATRPEAALPGATQSETAAVAPPLPPNNPPAAKVAVAPTYVAKTADRETVDYINQSLSAAWKANSVKPAEAATDAEWCRRVYLRVIGRIPTVDEAREFLADRTSTKRQKLIDRLLNDEEYVPQYADHWGTIWTNLLIGRTGGSDGMADRRGLEQYLTAALRENRPYDRIVFDLLTASGSARTSAPDFNGAVNFLLSGVKDDASLATGRTTRVFLGEQLQCAQCHRHPTGEWSQQQYWSLNSFFRQLKAEETPTGPRLIDVDYAGPSGDFREAEVYYQQPNGEMKAAYPQMLDGSAVSASGLISEINRRSELANWLVNSDQLPRAYVNRVWSHFFGYGFTRPVDDMGAHNQPVHPELLDHVAKQFVDSGYDMRALVRWIVLSEAFARSSKIPVGQVASLDHPEAGDVPLFSHYYARQMQAEEVYDSLLIAAKLRGTAGAAPEVAQAKLDWLSQFSRPMGTDDASEESHFDGSIRQSIIMLNGDLMNRAVSSENAGLLQGVVRSQLKPSEKLEHLFLAALSRRPTKREAEAAQKLMANNVGNEAQALEDVWWALLNSNEFILDH